MIADKIYPSCGGKMKKEIDTNEPIVIYRCLDCDNVEFERTNGYEG